MAQLLVVEDDACLLEIFIEYLDGLGFEVIPLSNGDSFCETVLKNRFDLIICDLILPGFNFAEEIEVLSCIQDPPRVIVMSGDTDELRKYEGRFQTLAKPFELEHFRTLIYQSLM